MVYPLRDRREILGVIIVVVFLLMLVPQSRAAQTEDSTLIMSDVSISVSLNDNGTSFVSFSSNVKNSAVSPVSMIDIRVELRTLAIRTILVNDRNVNYEVINEPRYSVVRVLLTTSLGSNESTSVSMVLSTNALQESLGLCEARKICLENMIYYLRPLNEFHNITFGVSLPKHAVLDMETVPLYPSPTLNYTDGYRLVFLWELSQILPGQERVYIVKYGIPYTQTLQSDEGTFNFLLIVASALLGGLAIFVLERGPDVIRSIRTPRIIAEHGVSNHDRQILTFLSQKGGSCSQSEIYRELDLSQSLVSMILSGLEERGMIRRIREGRENIVYMMEE